MSHYVNMHCCFSFLDFLSLNKSVQYVLLKGLTILTAISEEQELAEIANGFKGSEEPQRLTTNYVHKNCRQRFLDTSCNV